MFSKTDIQEKILQSRNNRLSERSILREVQQIFVENEEKRNAIRLTLQNDQKDSINSFDINLLDANAIFHISDIHNICYTYRLRFLPTQHFKQEIPEEAISEIRMLEARHNTRLGGFKIVAPAKLMKLDNADDPLLFAPMGNDYYYLIHKWGNDLHPLRKWLVWPFRSLENIAITIAIISALITATLPLHLFTNNPGVGEYFFTFLYTFNAIGGLALLWGVSKGKSFNGLIWNSKYYNG